MESASGAPMHCWPLGLSSSASETGGDVNSTSAQTPGDSSVSSEAPIAFGTPIQTPSLNDTPAIATARLRAIKRARELRYQQNRKPHDLIRLDLANQEIVTGILEPGVRPTMIDGQTGRVILPVITHDYAQPDDRGVEIWHRSAPANGPGRSRFPFECLWVDSKFMNAICPYLFNTKECPPLNIVHLIGLALFTLNDRGTEREIEEEILSYFPAYANAKSLNLLRIHLNQYFMEEAKKYRQIFQLAGRQHQLAAPFGHGRVWELSYRALDHIFAEFYGPNLSIGVEAPCASLKQRIGLTTLPMESLLEILDYVLLVDSSIHVAFDNAGHPCYHVLGAASSEKRQFASSEILAIAEAYGEHFRNLVHERLFALNKFAFDDVETFLKWLIWIGEGNRSLLQQIRVVLRPSIGKSFALDKKNTSADLKDAFVLLGQSKRLQYLDIQLTPMIMMLGSPIEEDWFTVLEDYTLLGTRELIYVTSRNRNPCWTPFMRQEIAHERRFLKTFVYSGEERIASATAYQPGSGDSRRLAAVRDSPTILSHGTLKRWARHFGISETRIDSSSHTELARLIAGCSKKRKRTEDDDAGRND